MTSDPALWTLRRAPADTGKKWEVRVPSPRGGRTVRFGARGYYDYTQHRNKERRESYRSRHRRDRINDPYAPGFWSWRVLWGDSTSIEKNFRAAVKKAKALLPGAGVRRNPLRARPPLYETAKVYGDDVTRTAKKGGAKVHRMGSSTAVGLMEFWSDVPEAHAWDLYAGVHVTQHPLVAVAYALPRRRIDYNDFGLEDVVDPPVLIGMKLPHEEIVADADVLQTAKDAVEWAERSLSDLDDEDDLQDYIYDSMAVRADAEDEVYDVDSFGLEYLGGDFGNNPGISDAVALVKELANEIDKGTDEDDLKQLALAYTMSIQPQGRVLRDVFEDEIATIVVLPAWSRGTDREEDPEHLPWKPLHIFNELTVPQIDQTILDESTVIYGDVDDAVYWHGTSLELARQAMPKILTPERVQEAVAVGSLYDFAELEAEAATWAEEDDDYE